MLTDKALLDVEFEGSRHAGDTVVRYQRGLGDQAQCIADKTAALLDTIRQRTGAVITTRSTIYLLRFDQQPQDFSISLTSQPDEFLLPLFIQAGQESCEAIVAQSRSYPYLLVHELVETSLVRKAGGSVLPDLSWGAPGLTMHLNNYTRWFRDGFANYAGYIAYETVAAEIPSEKKLYQQEALLHTEPFSSLAQVGDRLFSWPQSSRMELERMYYNAALGLFLVIADRFGEPAIRDIMHEIAQRRSTNGRDLIEITNRVLQTDVKQLARGFDFPRFGAHVEQMTLALALNRGVEPHAGLFVLAVPSGSPAARVGLREKDVIVAVGDTPVANHLDFELGIFKVRSQRIVPLTIQRAGVGTLTLDLPLR
ncbi:MAG: PDZ domain-containing protein [Planctomycetaceae bacterium]|nr:MAG: PDZ domain-containing protein [Planctomycetaceae bacterium]